MDQNHTTAAAQQYSDDSCCSTPYASAPSSPGRAGYYYSAPSSPTHFVISTAVNPSAAISDGNSSSFEFDFPSTFPPTGASADELFCNGQIRPIKLSTHLRRPQSLAPLIEAAAEEDHQTPPRGRDPKLRGGGSLRRRTRSMSPLRQDDDDGGGKGSDETTPSAARSSSAGRSSGRWVFLKEFLYRSKSEGRRSEGHNSKFWGALSFSPVISKDNNNNNNSKKKKKPQSSNCSGPEGKKRAVNNNINHSNCSSSKRIALPSASAHELHYTANRAQTEEMRKKTFLPYRQGLLGCLGFNSKSYDAINGFARALSIE